MTDRVRRQEGYLTGESSVDESGETHWSIDFFGCNTPLTVRISGAALQAAGVELADGSIVVADINMDATSPEELNLSNLEAGGRLPSLDEEALFAPGRTLRDLVEGN